MNMEEVTAEISGPVLASFYQKFSESKEDFLAVLFGSVDVQNYNENTDLATQTEKSTSRVTVQNWAIFKIDQVLNFQTGELTDCFKTYIKERKTFVGFLKFRKNSVELTPSFLDRKLFYNFVVRPLLFLLVGEEVTTTLSIKYNMTTLLIGESQYFQESATGSIPLVVPNLGSDQRIEYMQGRGGASKALKEMVDGTFKESSMMDVESNFKPLGVRFNASMDSISANLAQLERSRSALEEDVSDLYQEINSRLELSRAMKVVGGLQADLSTALEVAQYEMEEELG